MKRKPPRLPTTPKTRRLSEQETALWQTLNKDVTRLKTDISPDAFHSTPTPFEPVHSPAPLPRRPQGTFAPVIERTQLERPMVRHFRRGSITPTKRLDLHGVRQDVAEERLLRFVAEASTSGHSWVLVITGKGTAEQPSVLKMQVPRWLESLPEYVVSFTPALPEEGGAGALYVQIRKPR